MSARHAISPTGVGQDKLAPALIGSALVLAPAGIVASILLNGKEGAIGLIPPIGSALRMSRSPVVC
jgi:hypothetical protein